MNNQAIAAALFGVASTGIGGAIAVAAFHGGSRTSVAVAAAVGGLVGGGIAYGVTYALGYRWIIGQVGSAAQLPGGT